ncbi:MAG: M20/M25/M40 family metallo-hydrolase [Thermoanaerobaculia bacterium]
MSADVAARLAEFVAIDTVSGQEAPLADRIAEICEAAGTSADRPGRNVVASRGEGPPCLLLNSHLDTVPPTDGWTADPWKPRQEEGRLIGLGANDAKASVASMLEAFLTAPLPSGRGRLIFAATCDEETGGEGLEKLAPELSFDAAIVGEPNDFTVGISQKGLVKLRLTARGRAGHAARPRLAENAIVRAAEDVLAIETMSFSAEDPFLGSPTAAVTVVRGGAKSNVIPDRCELVVDARTVPGFDNERMVEAIRAVVSSDVEVISSRLRPVSGDPDWTIARAAQSAAPDRPVTGFPSVSDLAHLAGSPAIVFGPGTPEQSHRADESISIAALLQAPEVYRRTIAAFFALEESRT